jgi:hypothetical protein
MNEEKYIEERVGRRNPYKVPEGYFDAFTSQLMQQFPERPVKARQVRMRRPLYLAAACLAALLISGVAWMFFSQPEAQSQAPVQIAAQQESVEESIDEAADYMMLDNHEIYALLSEN